MEDALGDGGIDAARDQLALEDAALGKEDDRVRMRRRHVRHDLRRIAALLIEIGGRGRDLRAQRRRGVRARR